jgi:hypothetical protein
LCRAKDKIVSHAKVGTDALPSKIIGDKDVAELAAFNYFSALMLDVKAYKDADTKLDEEGESRLQQWKLLRQQHIQDVWRFQRAMQVSDVVFWEPTERVGLKANRKWLASAATACNSHRRKLRDIMGVKESDILQINVFCLYALGTAKKGVLDEIAAAVKSLKGLAVIFYPVTPKNSPCYLAEQRGCWRDGCGGGGGC